MVGGPALPPEVSLCTWGADESKLKHLLSEVLVVIVPSQALLEALYEVFCGGLGEGFYVGIAGIWV